MKIQISVLNLALQLCISFFIPSVQAISCKEIGRLRFESAPRPDGSFAALLKGQEMALEEQSKSSEYKSALTRLSQFGRTRVGAENVANFNQILPLASESAYLNEMLMLKPNLARAMNSVYNLLTVSSKVQQFFIKNEVPKGEAQRNLYSGFLIATRWQNGYFSNQAWVNIFSDTVSAYYPESLRLKSNLNLGPFDASLAEALKQIHQTEIQSGQMRDDVRVETDYNLMAELTVRFAHLVAFNSKTVTVTSLRNLLNRIKAKLLDVTEKPWYSDEVILGMTEVVVSEKLAIDQVIRLAGDLRKIELERKNFFRNFERVGIIRLAAKREISIETASALVVDLMDQISKTSGTLMVSSGTDLNRYLTESPVTSKGILQIALAMLIEKHAAPKAIAQLAKQSIQATLDEGTPTDWTRSRSTALLARVFLESTFYSQRAKILTAEAISGLRSSDHW